jgi:hypothetical protein
MYEASESAASLDLTIEQEGIGGLTGLTPTVAVRRARTTDTYLDWADGVFKTAGWTTKYRDMDEVERGHYTRNLDLSLAASAIAAGEVLSIEYHVDGGAPVIGDAQDILIVLESLYEIPGDVWDVLTASHNLPGTFGEALQSSSSLTPAQATQLLEIYKILGLDPTCPLIVSKTSRTAGATISQTIEKDVPVAGSVRITRI